MYRLSKLAYPLTLTRIYVLRTRNTRTCSSTTLTRTSVPGISFCVARQVTVDRLWTCDWCVCKFWKTCTWTR